MKRVLSVLLTVLLLAGLVPAAATKAPIIVVDIYDQTVEEGEYVSFNLNAVGENLTCHWLIVYEGNTYFLEDTSSGAPWIEHAGSDFGAYRRDNYFSFYFSEAGAGLDGATIYALITNGEQETYSSQATLTVIPAPAKLTIEVPSYIDTCVGETVDITCNATDSAGGELSYLWYSTNTEDITTIIAVNRGTETSATLRVPTDYIGVTFYCCMVSSSSGVSEYSDLVRVIVYEAPVAPVDPPEITTKTLPDATMGSYYWTKINSTDDEAVFNLYFDIGAENQFDDTGLVLLDNGEIGGYPAKAGTYGFTVCASGEGGEGYMRYELTVKEAPETTAEATSSATEMTTTEPVTTEAVTEMTTTVPTTSAPVATGQTVATSEDTGIGGEAGTTAASSDSAQTGDPDEGRINPDLEHGLPRGLRIALFVGVGVVLVLAICVLVFALIIVIKKLRKK
ncbi:MAG: hypothetical protein E7460_01330 [Ruminococcaceae bacterium]|nr:hypothetical protein [Oscillospiraceae bacterium]